MTTKKLLSRYVISKIMKIIFAAFCIIPIFWGIPAYVFENATHFFTTEKNFVGTDAKDTIIVLSLIFLSFIFGFVSYLFYIREASAKKRILVKARN